MEICVGVYLCSERTPELNLLLEIYEKVPKISLMFSYAIEFFSVSTYEGPDGNAPICTLKVPSTCHTQVSTKHETPPRCKMQRKWWSAQNKVLHEFSLILKKFLSCGDIRVIKWFHEAMNSTESFQHKDTTCRRRPLAWTACTDACSLGNQDAVRHLPVHHNNPDINSSGDLIRETPVFFEPPK